MSATKIISNMRVEADQKDVVIARLKEEVYHLKKNEQEYYLLEDQYRGLEHKYKLLLDEKVNNSHNSEHRRCRLQEPTRKCCEDHCRIESRSR